MWTSLGPATFDVQIMNSRLGVPCQGVASDGVALSLTPAAPRLVGGAERTIRINLATPLPPAARNVKLLYQLLNLKGQRFPITEFDKTIEFPGKFVGGRPLSQHRQISPL